MSETTPPEGPKTEEGEAPSTTSDLGGAQKEEFPQIDPDKSGERVQEPESEDSE